MREFIWVSKEMGNTIKCCIACMLPCGALDVVRVLHANGHVEEYSRTVRAGEVMKANPKHVLGLPSCQGLVQKTVVLPPDSELQRGKIYFLIPVYTLQKHKGCRPDSNGNRPKSPSLQNPSVKRTKDKRLQRAASPSPSSSPSTSPSPSPYQLLTSPQNANVNQSETLQQKPIGINQSGPVTKLVISEQCSAEVLCEKSGAHQDGRQRRMPRRRPESRRISRIDVWRPTLESISESESITVSSIHN